MTYRERIALVVCVAVHLAVLYNVWRMDQLTPRIVKVELCQRSF